MKLIRNLSPKLNKNGNSQSCAIFWCDGCNMEVERFLGNGLRNKTCGCLKIKHSETNTKLYEVWDNMKQRILNPNNPSYKNYGGRGITICNEWLEFMPFRDWSLDNGYADNLQINRINNDGNYEPSNCNFVTQQKNLQNRRTTKLNLEQANEIRYLYNTDNYTQQELANIFGVGQKQISDIINNKKWNN